MPSFSWTTNFSDPAALTNLVITPNTEEGSLVATVTASSDTYHEEYVFEYQTLDGEWVEFARTDDPEATLRKPSLNIENRLRVLDYNGNSYSEPIEAIGVVSSQWWFLNHLGGESAFIRELTHVFVGGGIDEPLDQVVLQPLPGPEETTAYPLIFTGAWQGDRISISITVLPDDDSLLAVFRRIPHEVTVGELVLQDPLGPVYIVQTGGMQQTRLPGGLRRVDLTAVEVA